MCRWCRCWLFIVPSFFILACAGIPGRDQAPLRDEIAWEGPLSGPPQVSGSPRRASLPTPWKDRAAAETAAVILNSMSLRDRIAQQFIAYLPPGLARTDLPAFLEERSPGGMILYRSNLGSSEDVRILTQIARDAAPVVGGERIEPLICMDQEGGRVSSLRFSDLVQLPSQFAVGRYGSENYVRALAYVNGFQIKELGITMNLAPVLDVTGDADASIIGDRSFGADPERVSRLGRAYLDGMSWAGVIPVIKHFPGHGSTRVDSHARLPRIDKPKEDLLREDLAPFRAAIAYGAPVVMTAHIVYPALDPERPATLSAGIVTDLLRKDLGFDGVVISDGFEMGALSRNYGTSEAVYLAFTAGVDMLLLYTKDDVVDMIDLVQALLQEGLLHEEEVNQSVARILRLKAAYGLIKSRR